MNLFYRPQIVPLPNEGHKSVQPGGPHRYARHETNYFNFGHFDWNVILHPFGDGRSRDGQPLIMISRQTSFDHLCRVKYRVVLGEGEQKFETETLEQLMDSSGVSVPYPLKSSMYVFTSGRNKLKVRLELLSAAAISECHLVPLNRTKNKTTLYDREKKSWTIESDSSLDTIKFRMFYTDAHNVPRKHLKRTTWNLMVVPRRGNYKPIKAIGCPLYHYHAQMEADVEGVDVDTNITVKEVSACLRRPVYCVRSNKQLLFLLHYLHGTTLLSPLFASNCFLWFAPFLRFLGL